MKKALAILLAMGLVCTLLPTTALAAATATEIVPPKYDSAMDFSEGLAAVSVGNDETRKWGFVDKTGKEVIPCKYFKVENFADGLAVVELDGKWGYIDKTGKEIVPLGKYSAVRGFSEGLAVVWDESGCGCIDMMGKEVVPTGKYFWIHDFCEGLAEVRIGGWMDGKSGFIDETGNEVVPCKYDEVNGFSEGFAAVYLKDQGWGFVDKTGKEVVPCRYVKNTYDSRFEFHEGLAAVYGDSGETNTWGDRVYGWGFVDKTGKEVIPCKYDDVHYDGFSEGFAAVYLKDQGWGFIDKTGREVVPCKYGGLGSSGFSSGLAAVFSINQGWGFIDKTGKEVVPCKYDDVEDFSEGFSVVRMGYSYYCEYGMVDKTGKEIVPCKYDGMNPVSEGLALVRMWDQDNGDRYGFIAIVDNTAYPSTQEVDVDGEKITFQCYALKDENGNDTNYIKLRDLADILNDSPAQFEVGWNGQVTIATKTAYTPNGSEQNTPFSGQREYKEVTAQTLVNGKARNLAAFTLTDDNGGGYTYYKLRDLGEALGFKVDWSAERGIFIETK